MTFMAYFPNQSDVSIEEVAHFCLLNNNHLINSLKIANFQNQEKEKPEE